MNEQVEKKLKALEIIKSKHQPKSALDLKYPKCALVEVLLEDLTKEECELLIEVLKN